MPKSYYRGIADITGSEGKWSFEHRWQDVRSLIEVHPEDHVLDVGCAEGLISLELAKLVRHVHAIEIEGDRIAAAQLLQQQRGVRNVAFEIASILDIPLAPMSYDVIFYLGVHQHLPEDLQEPIFRQVLEASRRSVAVRTAFRGPKEQRDLIDEANPPVVRFIRDTCAACGYDVDLHWRHDEHCGDIAIARRRRSASRAAGTGARTLPQPSLARVT